MSDDRQCLDSLVERLNRPSAVVCRCCSCSFDDCRGLFDHLQRDHGVRLPHSDNLIDVDGFLELVPQLCNRSLSATAEQVLACFARGTGVATTSSDASGEEHFSDVRDGNGSESDDEWDEADQAVQAQCLYCPRTVNDVAAHMEDKHGFEIRRSALFQRQFCGDEYARIRVINLVRYRVLQLGQCPQCDFSVTEIDAEALHEHIEERQHYLPVSAPSGDEWLAPQIQGDPLVMLVLQADDDDPEPEYPLVPTVLELANRRFGGKA